MKNLIFSPLKDLNILLSEYDNITLSEVEKKRDIYFKLDNPLNSKWLLSDFTDFSIYEDKDYKYTTIGSFTMESKGNIAWVSSKLQNEKINTILDFGCGIGLTSLYLAQKFPQSQIIALDQSEDELKFLEYMINYYRISNITISRQAEQADLVCCFECIEHNKNLDNFYLNLKEYLSKYLCYSARFSTLWVGHFNEYLLNGVIYSKDMVRRHLNKKISQEFFFLGNGWNGKPFLFRR